MARVLLYRNVMQHGRSRTRSREDSVKRRELEARRVPSLRPKQGEGQSTYQMQRPTGGREVLSPLPAQPLGADAGPATRSAARPTPAPASRSGTTSSHARPVVEPLYPARPVIELDRRRAPRRASTRPGPFGALPSAPVPQPLRAQHTPAPRAPAEETIAHDPLAPSSVAPSRIASASIASEPVATELPAPAAPPIARAPIAPSPPPVRSDPARHDATDLIRLHARSGAEAARRRLGWGWYIALAAAVAFFLATIALSSS